MIRSLLGLGILGLLLAAAPAAADNRDGPVAKEAVNKAIDKGVVFLKQVQQKDGSWRFEDQRLKGQNPQIIINGQNLQGIDKNLQEQLRQLGVNLDDLNGAQNLMRGQASAHDVGVTALAGLALLESGVPIKDPAVQNAAAYVRKAVPDLTATYSIGTAILFLDRINEADDVVLIKTLTARLLAGQSKEGCWTYNCPQVAVETVRYWTTPEQFLEGIARAPFQGGGDNSNSQFAAMGLWVGRRHQAPVSQALADYEKHCRGCQNAEGPFRYLASPESWVSACMTGAGLLGLACGHGAANEAALLKYAKSKDGPKPAPGKELRDLKKDQGLSKGLAAVEAYMKSGTGAGLAAIRPNAGLAGMKMDIGLAGMDLYLSLWSIERVAVVYDREKIGAVNWYNWGARILLARQEKNGSWINSGLSPGVDTAFALLFLRRSNSLPDLTATLKGVPQEPNPLFVDLALDDTERATKAMEALKTKPKEAVAFLKQQLRPATPADPRRLALLLGDLDSTELSVRDQASQTLEQLGELAAPALSQKLADPLTTAEQRQRVEQLLEKLTKGPSPQQLQAQRGVQLLEQLATPEAQALLKTLATGAEAASLTKEAKAALERLAKRAEDKVEKVEK